MKESQAPDWDLVVRHPLTGENPADGIVSQLFEAVECAYDTSNDLRDHLGMSQINGDCERKLYFNFHWYSIEKREGRMIRLLNRGNQEEPNFYRLLRKAGFKIRVRPGRGPGQFRFTDPDLPAFQGSLDGYIEKVPINLKHLFGGLDVVGLELKTAGQKAFKDMSDNGIERARPVYFGQSQNYMHQSHFENSPVPPLKAFLFLILNKNDDDLYAEIIPYDSAYGDHLRHKAHRILTAERPEELDRLSESPDWYQCGDKWCKHRKKCHFQESPEINCRTCKHSLHEQSNVSKWTCKIQNKILLRAEALKGCEHWEKK
jgi:hypothetical protein